MNPLPKSKVTIPPRQQTQLMSFLREESHLQQATSRDNVIKVFLAPSEAGAGKTLIAEYRCKSHHSNAFRKYNFWRQCPLGVFRLQEQAV